LVTGSAAAVHSEVLDGLNLSIFIGLKVDVDNFAGKKRSDFLKASRCGSSALRNEAAA